MDTAKLAHAAHRIGSKLLWIRINRLLAWALLLSPPVQIMMGTGFLNGIAFDLALLLVHGALSLALFGTPRAASFRAQHPFARFLGGKRESLAGRDRFLLDGWRILICVLNPWAVALLAYAVTLATSTHQWTGLLLLALLLACLYFNLLLPVSVLRHVRDASSYAYRRWHVPAGQALWLGWSTMSVFVVLSVANLFRGLWL